MNSLEEMKNTQCAKCKNFYDLDWSFDGWHNCCSEGNCYLCRQHYCSDYEEGDVPEGKIRGQWKE